MRIVLSGVETRNKGAELMLYAILQEIEHRWPDAEVHIPTFSVIQGRDYVKTPLDLQLIPTNWKYKYHLVGLLLRLGIRTPAFFYTPIVKHADYYLDGSGFRFSDQFNDPLFNSKLLHDLKRYKKAGTKIVFLPQAFGPIELHETRRVIGGLSNYANILMAREKVSYDYLEKAGADMSKVKKYTDFTSLVQGVFPKKYEHLKNGICIIPNKKMINKGGLDKESYMSLITNMIKTAEKLGHKAYLLNHEGPADAELMRAIKDSYVDKLDIITDLNALEVKGMIASSYLCISSRFHGVANALNSCVPCLATSWSHKYAELFNDYGQKGCVLDLNDWSSIEKKIEEFLDEKKNDVIRHQLKNIVPSIQEQTRQMWQTVWSVK